MCHIKDRKAQLHWHHADQTVNLKRSLSAVLSTSGSGLMTVVFPPRRLLRDEAHVRFSATVVTHVGEERLCRLKGFHLALRASVDG